MPKSIKHNSTIIFILINFGFFYIVYFSAKSFIQAKTQKKAALHDYAGVFFKLWMWPIGIWFIQPELRKMLPSAEADKLE